MTAALASRVVWRPNAPSPGRRLSAQQAFLSCPFPEALLEGGRGGGKTSALLVDFAQDVGRGFGAGWTGILFRRTYKELQDVVAKSRALFGEVYRGARFYESPSEYFWEWPGGERLLFRHMKRAEEYWSYHGHEYPWQGWEELTTWPDLSCYEKMASTCRSPHPAVAARKRRRATTNPWGPGHGAVKKYYVAPAPAGVPIPGKKGAPPRVRIYAPLEENRALLGADPHYLRDTVGTIDDENLRRAWEGGADRWEIVAGAYFVDLWRNETHRLPFGWRPPAHWPVTRSFDWGSARPFSLGWWAESPGELVYVGHRSIWMPRGTLVRFGEWYGSNGKKNEGLRLTAGEVAEGILARERDRGIVPVGGVADSQIWAEDGSASIASQMSAKGVYFTPCAKGARSRVRGWEEMRSRLRAALDPQPEDAGLYVTADCVAWLETVLALQRSEKDPEDIEDGQEDHAADETRYRVTATLGGGEVEVDSI